MRENPGCVAGFAFLSALFVSCCALAWLFMELSRNWAILMKYPGM